MMYLGDFKDDQAVHFIWGTNSATGASITRSTNGTVSVYKDNGLTQTVVGVTDTEDFDGLTGVHACTIVTTDAFYAVGANYTVVLSGATIDGQVVNAVLAHFSIENRNEKADVTKWLGTAAATPTVAGVPEVDVTHAAGSVQASIATQASVNTVDDFLDTEVAAIKAKTDNLPTDPADASDLAALLATISGYIDTEIAAILAAVDTEVAAIKAKTDNLPAAPAAVGDVPTAAGNAAALLDLANAIEVGVTPRQALRGILSAAAAKLSGAGTGTETFRNAVADSKNRLIATVDSSGNRSAITYDLT